MSYTDVDDLVGMVIYQKSWSPSTLHISGKFDDVYHPIIDS